MPRFALLPALALAVLVAGCAGPLAGPSPTPSATPFPTPSSTPYPDELVAFPDGPKDRPALPDDLTRESARAYAVAHEYRYSYNELYEPGAEVGLSTSSCSVEAANAAGDGYEVTVSCSGYVNRPADHTATPSVHYDLPPWTVRYYVDADSVLRTELD